MDNPHLAALETNVTPENWSGEMQVRSAIDGRITNSGVERYRQLNSRHLQPVQASSIEGEAIFLQVETNQSHISVAEAARTTLFRDGKKLALAPRVTEEEGYVAQDFNTRLQKGKALTIEKVVTLFTSRDFATSECGAAARKHLARAPGFDELLERHALRWDALWKRCRIGIEEGDRVAMILHLHIFHLLQTVSPNSIGRDVGVPPRGLHGEAYRGHVLWDDLFYFRSSTSGSRRLPALCFSIVIDASRKRDGRPDTGRVPGSFVPLAER